MANEFTKPHEVSDVDIAFPASVSRLMPPMAVIPDEFKRHSNPFSELAATWFFRGLDKSKLVPKDGIEKSDAERHLSCVLRSFEPKHEHKMAAVAYLMSLWFEDPSQERT